MIHHVLFVDDEENILKSMERIFHSSPFELHFAPSGEEALKIIQEQEMSVIISDMKMPGMSGVDFLKASEDYCPDATRIILSAFSDIEDIMNAVNKGHVHNYLTKPWENERLKIVLYNGILNYEKNIQVKNMAKELASKNEQLEEMNSDLEEVIMRRSQELAERNRILQKMISNSDSSENLKECIQSLKSLIGEKNISLYFEGDCQKSFSQLNSTPPDKLLKRAKELTKPSIINKYFFLPLKIKESCLGYLIIEPMVEEDRIFFHEINSIAKLIKLILNQSYNLSHTANIMSSYDSLLEELSD